MAPASAWLDFAFGGVTTRMVPGRSTGSTNTSRVNLRELGISHPIAVGNRDVDIPVKVDLAPPRRVAAIRL
jgi:hypothetical protein